MLTRIFRTGDSLAVGIPEALGFADTPQEVEIERVGNHLVIRPVAPKSLAGLAAILASFPPGFMAEGREFHEQADRDWTSSSPPTPK